MQKTYFCLTCKGNLGFTTKNRLRHHCASVHPETLAEDVIAGRPFSMHAAKCFLCRISFKFVKELRKHLKTKHTYDPGTVSLQFISLLEFEKWKNQLEGKTYAKYRKQCGNKKGLQYYVCSSRAIGVEYSPGQKQFQVAYKMHESCTSQIVVSNRDGIKVVFHARHYGHAQVPVDAINEFYALHDSPQEDISSKITEIPKKLREDDHKIKDLDSYRKLNCTVLNLFQKKIKSTTNDIENEISKLMGKEISCEMAESLKFAWLSIKNAKMKLIEANKLSREKEANEETPEEYLPKEKEESLKRNGIDICENEKKTKRFDSISIIDGSIRLRRYDEKYKGNSSINHFEIGKDEFRGNDHDEYQLSNYLTIPTYNAVLQDSSDYFDYDDFLKQFNASDSAKNEINMPIS